MGVDGAYSVSVAQQPQSGISNLAGWVIGGKSQNAQIVRAVVVGVVFLGLVFAAVWAWRRRP